MSEKQRGGVSYREADASYFEKRSLRRFAGVWSLWALGVGAVISGDFFGWNFGLLSGGFGGLLVATVIVAVMYIGLCFSIAELSPALPHTGGAYSFGRTAFGPWGGFLTGLAESIEYVLTPAVIVVGIGGYVGTIAETAFGLSLPAPIWWALFYVIFVGVNIAGVELTFRVTIAITILALLVLVVFWIGALPLFRWEHALSVTPDPGATTWFPRGLSGISASLPFAIWFYLAIEQLPLAAEESHDPKRDMPRGLLWGIATLIVASILTLFLNAGIAPGAAVVGASEEPLFSLAMARGRPSSRSLRLPDWSRAFTRSSTPMAATSTHSHAQAISRRGCREPIRLETRPMSHSSLARSLASRSPWPSNTAALSSAMYRSGACFSTWPSSAPSSPISCKWRPIYESNP